MQFSLAFVDSIHGFKLFLSAAVFTLLMICAGVSNARADQNDPRLPELFQALKAASDSEEGERIGRRIAQIWDEHDNQGVNEIMQQGQGFAARGQVGLALGNFTTVARMEPGFAEAWNKHASVLYNLGRLDDAVRSIADTLARGPRQFLAMAGLGLIHLQMGYLEEALRAFDYTLGINPHLAGTRTAAEKIRQRLSN